MSESDMAPPRPVPLSGKHHRTHQRIPFFFFLCIIALAGYFWTSFGAVLNFSILMAIRPQGEEQASVGELLRWPVAYSAAKLIIVTILLAGWIAYGRQLHARRPIVAAALATLALLPHLFGPLGLIHFALVLGDT